jgi:Tol biopolymer transport system component
MLLFASTSEAAASVAWPGSTSRVSVSASGREGNGESGRASLSAHGRYVAFWSEASNLVSGDANESGDVFVRDRLTGAVQRVSVGRRGRQGGGGGDASISQDGRYIAYVSGAADLVAGDTNGAADVFVYDRLRRLTTRVSVGPKGRQANNDSSWPKLSADGRYVLFESDASNLVPGDTNRVTDIFVRDRFAGVTERVSVDSRGRQGYDPSLGSDISGNGRYVAFGSASKLTPGDNNHAFDVFIRDRRRRTTRLVSVSRYGGSINDQAPQYRLALSSNGRYVAFDSNATNLVRGDSNGTTDVFVRDWVRGVTGRISVGAGGRQVSLGGSDPVISADGRYVAYSSDASNLVPGDTNDRPDVFVRDGWKRVTYRISVGAGGHQANDWSLGWSISADGQHVGFDSEATNLVAGDKNGVMDAFVWDAFTDASSSRPVGAAQTKGPSLSWLALLH